MFMEMVPPEALALWDPQPVYPFLFRKCILAVDYFRTQFVWLGKALSSKEAANQRIHNLLVSARSKIRRTSWALLWEQQKTDGPKEVVPPDPYIQEETMGFNDTKIYHVAT